MRTNEAGRQLIMAAEGFASRPYLCPAGVWSIGFGSTQGVTRDTPPVTRLQAEAMLEKDLRNAESIVEQYVEVPLNENQHGALVSFVFNVGPGRRGYKDGFAWLKNGRHSTMLTLLNSGNYAGASQQFGRWVNANGRPLPGLVRRRAAEQRLFNSPTEGTWNGSPTG